MEIPKGSLGLAQKSERSANYYRFRRGLTGCIIALLVIVGVVLKNRLSLLEYSQSSPSKLRSAPDFTLPDSESHNHSLQELKGRWVILHFWASWCPPCLQEIKEWAEFSRRINPGVNARVKNPSIQFVAISLDQNWQDALKALPRERNQPDSLLSLLDTSGKIAELFGTFQFPETYLINPELKIITKWVGPQEWNSPQLTKFFKQLVELNQTK